MDRILIRPMGDGWAVETPIADNPMVFRSGRAAEDAGKRLAERLARTGTTTELEMRLRSGARGARLVCVPPTKADEAVLVLSLPGLAPSDPQRAVEASGN